MHLPLVSNVTGRIASNAELARPDYWSRHAREAVQFWQGLQTLQEQDCDVYLEVGPHPVLLGIAKGTLSTDVPCVPSLRKGRSDWTQIQESLAALYVRGAHVDWAGYEKGYSGRKVSLPTYPFQRRRFAPSFRVQGASPGSPQSSSPPVHAHRASQRSELHQVHIAATARTEQERLLADAFSEVLGLQEIMVDDNFFDLGGDSLIAVQLANVISRVFDVKIPVRTILLSPSVSELLPHLSPWDEKN